MLSVSARGVTVLYSAPQGPVGTELCVLWRLWNEYFP